MRKQKSKKLPKIKIAIIGGGIVGTVVALFLQKTDKYDVTLFEKNDELFKGVSGTFGLRLHVGPHYPRSSSTREGCLNGLKDVIKEFPNLFVNHEYSIYGLGQVDIEGNPSKVSAEEFAKVCKEIGEDQEFVKLCKSMGYEPWQEIDLEKTEYTGLHNAFNVYEPSNLIGEGLRTEFKKYLNEAGVKVICNYEVKNLKNASKPFSINTPPDAKESDIIINDYPERFAHVVNATYYQDILPNKPLPLGIEAVYQPCLTLRYREKKPSLKGKSYTILDGKFFCIMPRENQVGGGMRCREYTLYHANNTILKTFQTPESARIFLEELKSDPVSFAAGIEAWRPEWENDVKRFYPAFSEEFEFVGVDTGIASKFKTETDFRSGVVFESTVSNQDKEEVHVIDIFSGKINNVIALAKETQKHIETNRSDLVHKDGYYYLKEGEFNRSQPEILLKPKNINNSTSHTNAFDKVSHLFKHLNTEKTSQGSQVSAHVKRKNEYDAGPSNKKNKMMEFTDHRKSDSAVQETRKLSPPPIQALPLVSPPKLELTTRQAPVNLRPRKTLTPFYG